MDDSPDPKETDALPRHFGLLQSTALNVTLVVGAGVFITIPLMLRELPGPYALLGWVVAGILILLDGLIWSELAAAIPGSGGSYLYLLECYGPRRWGRLMAFLFIWQFLISGPLEIASGLIAMAQFGHDLSPGFARFDEEHTSKLVLGHWQQGKELALILGPARLAVFGMGLFLLWLLYRRITSLGRLTVTFWIGVLAVIAWITFEGAWSFNSSVAFDFSGRADRPPADLGGKLGAAMILAIYSYLGYYNVCYIGDEVRNPARTIPRSIQISALLVCVLFIGLHLAMLGTVPWQQVPTESPALDTYSLPAAFMAIRHGEGSWAVSLVSLLLIWSCIGAAFAGLLGYSRIPYGAARRGHFFAAFAQVHPVHGIPHRSLLLVGVLTLFWSFFDLQNVIDALIVTRILEQFIGQAIGLMLLHAAQPTRPWPYRMPLYPLPCVAALVGWVYLYLCAAPVFIFLGLATLAAGTLAFWAWSKSTAAAG